MSQKWKTRPMYLKGHDRPVSTVLFNTDGDLLFTSGKDSVANAWYSHNGERLGTYDGHRGAINDVAVSADTSKFMTGAGDSLSIVWDTLSGKPLFRFNHDVGVRSCDFSSDATTFLNVTDKIMGREPKLKLYKLAADLSDQVDMPVREITGTAKITCAKFGSQDSIMYTTDGSGNVTTYDTETGDILSKVKVHEKEIFSFNFDREKLTLVTASNDCSAKLLDAKTLECIQTYETNVPVRAASISPWNDHVILGGGQAAKDVTTTRVDQSQFAVRFFHKIFGDLIATVKGHFGPINSIAWSPDGKSYATGGEDGFSHVVSLPDAYFENYSKEMDIENNRITV